MNDHGELHTARLRLEPLAGDHAEALFAVLSDPQAVRFWHAPPHNSIDQTRAYIRELVEGRARAWAVIPREQPSTIGLVYYLSDQVPVGMGYIFHSSLWGRGIAKEAVQQALDYGWRELGLDRVELWIESENSRSLALAVRLGFVRRGAFRRKYSHRDNAFESLVLGLYASENRTRPRASAPDHFYGCVSVLAVPDVAGTVDYYREKLGFSLEFIHGEPAAAARVRRSDWSGPGTRVQFQRSSEPSNLVGLALYFDVGPGIDGLFDCYRSLGVQIERAPETMPWGIREFALRDCNGVLLRFATPA
jgi:RimJ/RimL family protein N-acetyltransferase/catechol 2,3-dioxygenase-like lactoylglutathione lyase family enzyme